MKKTKTSLILILAGTVAFSVVLWLYSSNTKLDIFEYIVAVVVAVTVIFSIIVGYKRIKNEKKGLPADDELSNKIKRKAASKAYIYSIYMWVVIYFFTRNENIGKEVPLGLGIIGMGLIFIIFWIYYSKQGIDNENNN